MERTFTLAEADALLPAVSELLRSALEAKRSMDEADAQFHQLSNRIEAAGGMALNVEPWAMRRAQRDKAARRAQKALEEIQNAGVQVKDLEIGLLDFPCRIDGDTILLCWKLGEPAITHWHGMTEGFRGRKPIDDHIARHGC